jgi:hypothetical protein
MSAFKRKPLPDEVNAALKSHASSFPSTLSPAATGPVAELPNIGEGRAPKAPPTVQCNFNCTVDLADLIADLAKQAGSTRRAFARLLRDAGHAVPAADLDPFDNRRRARRQ